MSEIDTGFDAVIAGEVYTPPAENPTVTVVEHVPTGPHVCASVHPGNTRCDTCFEEFTATVKPELPPAPSGLTPAGIQAAKALVNLPELSWPDLAKLAREMAMDIKERHVILKEFKLSNAQYDFLEAHNDFFRQALAHACREWHAPLSTQERIKVEAAAILEDSLLGLGARIQNKGEGLPGVVEAAKLFAKIAGVGEREVGSAAPGERFTINIDLGGDAGVKLTTITGASSAPELPSDAPLLTKQSRGAA